MCACHVSDIIGMKNLPIFSIIIPAYNSGKIIPKCLESLALLDYPREKYEIIVVDSGTDNTLDICEHLGVKCYKVSDRLTAGMAINKGVSLAKGDVIAIIGADHIVPNDWLKRIASDLEEHPEVCGVSISLAGGKTAFTKWINQEYESHTKEIKYLDLGSEACLVLKKRVFQRGCRFGASPQNEGYQVFSWLKENEKPLLVDKSIRTIHLKQASIKSWVLRQFPLGRIHAINEKTYFQGIISIVLILLSLFLLPLFWFFPLNLLPSAFLSSIFLWFELKNKIVPNKRAPLLFKIAFGIIGVISKWIFWLGYSYQILFQRQIPLYNG